MPISTRIGATFVSVLEEVRSRFLLPNEQVGRFAVEEVDDLVAELETLREDPARWMRIASLFPRRHLSLLFPALLRTENKEFLQRIVEILALRATPSLHALGWAHYQHFCADPRMVEAFSALHASLKAKNPGHCPPLPVDDADPIDGAFPRKVFERMREQKVKEIAPYFDRYGILADTSFARAVLVGFFSSCSDEEFSLNREPFLHMLPNVGEEDGGRILENYLKEPRQGLRYRALSKGILGAIGSPDSGNPMWTHVSAKSQSNFWESLITQFVEDHLSGSSRKFSLLLHYMTYVLSVRPIGKDILAMEFGSFYLMDDRRTPESIYYYEKAVFETWLESIMAEAAADDRKRGPLGAGSPGSSLSVHLSRHVMMDNLPASAVLLDIGDVGLLFVRDFLDTKLRIGSKAKEMPEDKLF